MGDSFIEGSGFSYKDTIVGVMEELNPNLKFLNGGVASYSPKLYHLKVKYLIEEKKLDFDEVILFICISDIMNEIKYQTFIPKVNLPLWDQVDQALKKYSFTYRVFMRPLSKKLKNLMLGELQAGVDWSEIKQREYSELSSWTYDERVYESWGKFGVELAIKEMEKLVTLLKKNNISIRVVVFPWPNQILKRDLESKQVKIWSDFCHSHEISFFSLFETYINEKDSQNILDEYYIKGDVHWNKAGLENLQKSSMLGGKMRFTKVMTDVRFCKYCVLLIGLVEFE